MEQITKRHGEYYYGERACRDADDAYKRLRKDYYESLGRVAAFRFNAKRRKERIHGFGFVFAEECKPRPLGTKRVQCWMLGMLDICYCRMFGQWDIPVDTEEEFDTWFDWALSQGSGAIMTRDLHGKKGRTSKKYLSKHKNLK